LRCSDLPAQGAQYSQSPHFSRPQVPSCPGQRHPKTARGDVGGGSASFGMKPPARRTWVTGGPSVTRCAAFAGSLSRGRKAWRLRDSILLLPGRLRADRRCVRRPRSSRAASPLNPTRLPIKTARGGAQARGRVPQTGRSPSTARSASWSSATSPRSRPTTSAPRNRCRAALRKTFSDSKSWPQSDRRLRAVSAASQRGLGRVVKPDVTKRRRRPGSRAALPSPRTRDSDGPAGSSARRPTTTVARPVRRHDVARVANTAAINDPHNMMGLKRVARPFPLPTEETAGAVQPGVSQQKSSCLPVRRAAGAFVVAVAALDDRHCCLLPFACQATIGSQSLYPCRFWE
jgi:hypothetical protein